MIEQDCTIEHGGKTFEAGGAIVAPDFCIAYIGPNGALNDWHGRKIGTIRVRSSWRVSSWMGTHMHQIEATVDGVTYTGRSFGEGMIYRGRRKARQ